MKRFPECRFAAEYVWVLKDFLETKRYKNPNMRLQNQNETKRYKNPNMRLQNQNINTGSPVTIIYSVGATEAKPPDLADAIAENIETKHTLRDNNLKIVDTVLDYSTARLIANTQSLHDREKAAIIEYIERMLMSVVDARSSYHLYANIPIKYVEKACNILPSITSPTISECADGISIGINTIIPKDQFSSIYEELNAMDATGIMPKPIDRIFIDPLPPRLYEE